MLEIFRRGRAVCIMGCSVGDTVAVGASGEFIAPMSRSSIGTSRIDRSLVLPIGMTIRNLIIEHNDDQAVSEMVCTMDLDSVPTALTLNIPIATAGNTSNLVNSFHGNLGQEITLHLVSPVGSTSARIFSFCMIGILDA